MSIVAAVELWVGASCVVTPIIGRLLWSLGGHGEGAAEEPVGAAAVPAAAKRGLFPLGEAPGPKPRTF